MKRVLFSPDLKSGAISEDVSAENKALMKVHASIPVTRNVRAALISISDGTRSRSACNDTEARQFGATALALEACV